MQGLLEDGDVPAAGLFDFQVCLFDHPTDPLPLNCMPDFAARPVERGLFSLSLDFGPGAFIGQARFIELRVRRSGSSSGYTILAPRQPVLAAPEALNAARASSAPWSGLVGVPVGFADGIDNNSGGTVTAVTAGAGLSGGTITGSGTLSIATGGVTLAMLAQDSVDGSRVVDGSVGAAEIAPQSVGAGHLAPNAVDSPGIADGGVSTVDLADGAVNASKLAAGSIAAVHIDPDQVQRRIVAGCPPGEYLKAVGADGSPLCGLLPAEFYRILPGASGGDASLALGADDVPVVVYSSASSPRRLSMHRCDQPSCATSTERTLDASADVGYYNAVALRADGRAVISYYDLTNQNLKLYRCDDPECATGEALTLDGLGSVGAFTSIGLRADGRAVVAYYDSGGGDLKLYICANSNCTTGISRTLDGGAAVVGRFNTLILRADDRPLIAYHDDTNDRLLLHVCSNIDCSMGNVRVIDSTLGTGNVGGQSALALLPDGSPIITYLEHDAVEPEIRRYICANSECTSGSLSGSVAVSYTRPGLVVREDGMPLIAYAHSEDPNLGHLFLECRNSPCTFFHSPRVIDRDSRPGGRQQGTTPVALRGDGRPVLLRDQGELRLRICANAGCLWPRE
jgi:hypothetical protein